MGLIQKKEYKIKNRITGLWEVVKPDPVEYSSNEKMKPINVRANGLYSVDRNNERGRKKRR